MDRLLVCVCYGSQRMPNSFWEPGQHTPLCHESRTQTPIQFFVDVHERKNACMLREEGGGDSRFRARGKELQI